MDTVHPEVVQRFQPMLVILLGQPVRVEVYIEPKEVHKEGSVTMESSMVGQAATGPPLTLLGAAMAAAKCKFLYIQPKN